jgi:hypothetical protein
MPVEVATTNLSARSKFVLTKDVLLDAIRRVDLPVFALILFSNFVANYLLFQGFGLYEDDWAFFGSALDAPPPDGALSSQWLAFFAGRPIQLNMMTLGADVLFATQSLAFLYILAWLLTSFATLLFYFTLRLRFDRPTACLAAVCGLLAPIHTVNQMLNGALTFWFAIAALSSAILLYARRDASRVLAYAIAFLVLCTYESFFFLFLAAPLFLRDNAKPRTVMARYALHSVSCVAVIGAYLAIRAASGQRPVTGEGSPIATFTNMLIAAWNAMLDGLDYVQAISQHLSLDVGTGVIACLSAVVLVGVVANFSNQPDSAKLPLDGRRDAFSHLRGIAFAGVLIGLGYAVAYFVQQYTTVDFTTTTKASRVHSVAALGHGVLMGVIIGAVLHRSTSLPIRLIGGAVAALFISVLFADRLGVQRDYVAAWDRARENIRQMISLAPDLSVDGAILVEQRWEFFYPRLAIGDESHAAVSIMDSLFLKAGDAPQPFIQFVPGPIEAWIGGARLSPDGSKFNVGDRVRIWLAREFPTGATIPMRFTETLDIERENAPLLVEGRVATPAAQQTVWAESYWATATPSVAFSKLMPDVHRWFLWWRRQQTLETPCADRSVSDAEC